MEDYITKRNYLNHLKNISAIKNGQCKSILLKHSRVISLPQSTAPQQRYSPLHTLLNSNTLSLRTPPTTLKRAKSTQHIMKTFLIQKQNLRLVSRIGAICSDLNMTKYDKQYKENKRIMRCHSKIKKKYEFFKFKIFDIKFQDSITNANEVFSLYEVNQNKKKLLCEGNIFELRKLELRTSRAEKSLLKIQGRNWGMVELKMQNMLPIKRNKVEIGSLIIDIF